jgi:hypothetical protein
MLLPCPCNYLNASLTNVHSVSWWYTFELSFISIQFQSKWLIAKMDKSWALKRIVWTSHLVTRQSKTQSMFTCLWWWRTLHSNWVLVANRKAVHCRVYCWYCNPEHVQKKYLVFKIYCRNISLTYWVHRGAIQILQTQNSFSFHMKMCLRMSACIRAHIRKQ